MIFFSGDIQRTLFQARSLPGPENPNVQRAPDGSPLEVPQINNSTECGSATP